ncbi:MAG: ABC transporter ATP-binding protein [Lautropia sp.]
MADALAKPPKILVSDLVKSFKTDKGRERIVLDRISFSLAEGTFATAVGPSGCGKSTLLNVIAGLTPPTSGVVELGGERMDSGKRINTRVGYVFQQPRLLNWQTVRQNLEFVLLAGGIPPATWRERIEWSLRLVGLLPYENTYPMRLSGGQQQRVSIARALVTDPDLVLMDEPFSHLDEITAARLRDELTDIWMRTGKTVLFITHSISEAVLLSQTVLVLSPDGTLGEQVPIDIEQPRREHEDRLFEAERGLRLLTRKWWAQARKEETSHVG